MKKGVIVPRILAGFFGLLLLWGCRADDEVRAGEVGEFCNGRDSDCREGLACELGACAELGPRPIYSCDEICARLDECGATDAGCASDCRLTIAAWELRAKNEFGVCLVEGLSCAEAQEGFAPQTCYQRIEIPELRDARCDDFSRAAGACGAGLDTREVVLEGCYALARVSTDAAWVSTERCVRAVETGVCSGIATCFNEEFGLDPMISLGN